MLQCDTEQRGTTPNKTLRTTENSNMLPKKKKNKGRASKCLLTNDFKENTV